MSSKSSLPRKISWKHAEARTTKLPPTMARSQRVTLIHDCLHNLDLPVLPYTQTPSQSLLHHVDSPPITHIGPGKMKIFFFFLVGAQW